MDGEPVSKKRVIAKDSEHTFTVDGDEYKIRFTVTGKFFCEVTCDLIKNGEIISSQPMRSVETVKIAAVLFGFGLLVGFLAAKAALMVMG